MLNIKSFVFSPIQENTYLLFDDQKNCAIIDPGCYFDDEKEQLVNYIEQHHLVPQLLLNTHGHLDHVFGNKFIAEKYNLTPQIHAQEKPMIDFAPTAALMYNMPFDNYTSKFIFIKENDKILIGTDELLVIEAPGHSPGHICFYCKKQNFIISGDVLFNQSIGRTDLPGGNSAQLIKNIKEKLLVLPHPTIVYSGHGNPTTIGAEKISNPFLK